MPPSFQMPEDAEMLQEFLKTHNDTILIKKGLAHKGIAYNSLD